MTLEEAKELLNEHDVPPHADQAFLAGAKWIAGQTVLEALRDYEAAWRTAQAQQVALSKRIRRARKWLRSGFQSHSVKTALRMLDGRKTR